MNSNSHENKNWFGNFRESSTAMAHFPDNQIVYKEIIVEVTVSEEKSDI